MFCAHLLPQRLDELLAWWQLRAKVGSLGRLSVLTERPLNEAPIAELVRLEHTVDHRRNYMLLVLDFLKLEF